MTDESEVSFPGLVSGSENRHVRCMMPEFGCFARGPDPEIPTFFRVRG